MARSENCPRPQTILLCTALLLWGAAPGALAQDTKPQAASDSLAQYYGFAPMEILKFDWSVGAPICSDVNGDGLTDLVVANNAKARIDLLLQKKDFQPGQAAPAADQDEEDINEVHTKEAQWRFKRVSFDLDVAALHLLVADLNHDGWEDLVYYAESGLYVALQEPPKPAPKPAPKGGRPKGAADPAKGEKAPAPREPSWLRAKKIEITDALKTDRALAAGDLNGDGRTDLAILTPGGIHVVLQKADGTLEKPVKYQSGGQRLRRVHIADLDGDGRDDLVLLTGQQDLPLRVRFQTAAGKLGAEMQYEMPYPSVFEVQRLGKSRRALLLTVSAHSGRVQISTLGADPAPRAYPVRTYPLPGTESADKRDAVAADLNGDGLLDLVASDPSRAEFLVYLADAKTSLEAAKHFPGLMEMEKLRAGDLDGSGRAAIVALSRKEKIIGITRLEKGRLRFPAAVPTEGDPLEMDLADVDGDGQLDLLYIRRDSKLDKYFLHTLLSVGRKTARPGPAAELSQLRDKPTGMSAADIDHDGRTDVMILRPYGPLLLVRQQEAGKFAEVTRKDIHSGLVASVYPSAMSLGPLGPKGTTTLLLGQKNFARSLVFDPKTGWTVVDQYQAVDPDSHLAAAVAMRLPGAESHTIVTYDSARRRLALLGRDADGTFRPSEEIEVGSLSLKHIFTGNFGGEAKTSILLCGTHKAVAVSLGTQRQVVRKLRSYQQDDEAKLGPFGRLAVGDVNHDGVPELVLCEYRKNHVQILAFDAKGELVDAAKFKVFERHRQVERSRLGEQASERGEPRAIRLADVTGDGKTDLILLVHDRILLYPQE